MLAMITTNCVVRGVEVDQCVIHDFGLDGVYEVNDDDRRGDAAVLEADDRTVLARLRQLKQTEAPHDRSDQVMRSFNNMHSVKPCGIQHTFRQRSIESMDIEGGPCFLMNARATGENPITQLPATINLHSA